MKFSTVIIDPIGRHRSQRTHTILQSSTQRTFDRLNVLQLAGDSERRRLGIGGVLLDELVGGDGDATELRQEVEMEVGPAVLL